MENITQTWEDPSEPIWTYVDSSTITKTQIDVGDFEDSWDRYNYIPVQTQDVAVLVSCESGAENLTLTANVKLRNTYGALNTSSISFITPEVIYLF